MDIIINLQSTQLYTNTCLPTATHDSTHAAPPECPTPVAGPNPKLNI